MSTSSFALFLLPPLVPFVFSTHGGFDPRCCLRTNFAKTILASCALLQIPNIRAHCWSHTLPTLSQTYQQAATFLTLLCSLVVVALQQVAIAWTLASWLTASEAQNLRNVSISQDLHFHMATMDNARACSQYKRYHRAIGSLKPSDAILGVMGAFLQFFQRSVRTIRKRGSISSLTKMLFLMRQNLLQVHQELSLLPLLKQRQATHMLHLAQKMHSK